VAFEAWGEPKGECTLNSNDIAYFTKTKPCAHFCCELVSVWDIVCWSNKL